MPINTRTFRVFISSTFEDLGAERNALAAPGGPFERLAKVCQELGARFQPIDLRWGIREEAARDQRTVEICLGEIRRCQKTGLKPNFIILLGSRYGWQPLPSRIEALEFQAIRATVSDESDRKLLDDWYPRLDLNADPAEHPLKPRNGEFIERNRWKTIETRLHQILLDGARAAGLSSSAIIKYQASATHQEIIQGIGSTEEDRKHVFAFFCRASAQDEEPKLRELKTFLRGQLGKNVYEVCNLAELQRQVYDSVSGVIRDQTKNFGVQTAIDQECNQQGDFADAQRRHFRGREEILRKITDYIADDDRRPLILHGVPGSGKSATIAQVAALTSVKVPNAVTVRRFIGVTPDSSNGLTLLRSLCTEIGLHYGRDTKIPVNFDDVANLFHERLSLATFDRPLHLYVDALDQLGPADQASSLTWLPAVLPPACRVVLSVMEVPSALRNARGLALDALSATEADAALAAWLQDESRNLQDWQRAKLLTYFDRSGLPLYLKLAFEEARHWRSFDEKATCELRDGLDGIIDLLFDRLSLDSNHGKMLVSRAISYLTAARSGLTEDEIIDVLSTDEDVWSEFIDQAHHPAPSRRLPVVIWARLLTDLEPYLTQRVVPGGTVISFYHRQLLERAKIRFFKDDGVRAHDMLARLFEAQPTWLARTEVSSSKPVASRGRSWFSKQRTFTPPDDVPNQRKLFEYPFQQACAGEAMRAKLEETLLDLAFLEAKCLTGLQYDLLDDCDRALSINRSETIAVVREAIASALPSIKARSTYSLQALCNRLLWAQDRWPALRGPLADAQERLRKRGAWLRYTSRVPRLAAGVSCYPLGLKSPMQALSRSGTAIAVANVLSEFTVHRLSTGEVIWRGTLGVKSVAAICLSEVGTSISFLERNGRITTMRYRASLQGRPDETAIVDDDDAIIGVRNDNALVAWRPERDECVTLAENLPKPVVVLRVTEGGLFCVAGFNAQHLGLRLRRRSTDYRTLPYEEEAVIDGEIDIAGSLVGVACRDHQLRILDVHSGSVIAAVSYEKAGNGRVRGAPIHCTFGRGGYDGRLVFATSEGQIGCWDWQAGTVERIDNDANRGTSQPIVLLRCLGSGQLVVSTSDEVTLLGAGSRSISELMHCRAVTAVGLLDSGKVVSFSSGDRSIIWHPASPQEPIVRQTLMHATAMIVLPGTDIVVIGDDRGYIARVAPIDGSTERTDIAYPFPWEGVCALCPSTREKVIAAAPSGQISCVTIENGIDEKVRYSANKLIHQESVMPASRVGACWSNHGIIGSLDTERMLTLLTSSGREKVVFRVNANTASTCDGGATICFADSKTVQIHRRRGLKFSRLVMREVVARQVAFLQDTGLLAVARLDDHWLEIWRVERDAPVIAAIELPDDPVCMTATENALALGFKGGNVISLRLCGGATTW